MTTIAAPAGVAEPFAARLRSQTQTAHTRAENAGFMSKLMGGEGTVQQYVALIGQYYFIYEALERVGETFRTDAIGSAFIDEALLRREALEADLAYFGGADWRETLHALPATEAYVERLESVTSRSELFVAHHYLRYLGDLSGGQIIRVMVQRHYGIPDEGLNFLIFAQIPKSKPFKDDYRLALEDAAWSADERDEFILEVDRAYGLNYDLFTQLGETTAAK